MGFFCNFWFWFKFFLNYLWYKLGFSIRSLCFLGSYTPGLHTKHGSEIALRLGRDSDRDSIISSEMSLSQDQQHYRLVSQGWLFGCNRKCVLLKVMLDMWIRACNNYDYNEKYMLEHFIYGYRSNMLQSLCNVISNGNTHTFFM